jgi:hypothetical protein
MYEFSDATAEELEKLRDFIDAQHELSFHVEADLEWWMTGHWKLQGGEPVEFTSMEDLLLHLRQYQ